mmetsp:Transcript_55163/g.175472  ORF Transcript_55163/g.175472 Transcript_55163/m.175472 type:complete len:211 (+) Transcript_55163:553-1185(+)
MHPRDVAEARQRPAMVSKATGLQLPVGRLLRKGLFGEDLIEFVGLGVVACLNVGHACFHCERALVRNHHPRLLHQPLYRIVQVLAHDVLALRGKGNIRRKCANHACVRLCFRSRARTPMPMGGGTFSRPSSIFSQKSSSRTFLTAFLDLLSSHTSLAACFMVSLHTEHHKSSGNFSGRASTGTMGAVDRRCSRATAQARKLMAMTGQLQV